LSDIITGTAVVKLPQPEKRKHIIAGIKERLLAYIIDSIIILGTYFLIWPVVLTHLKVPNIIILYLFILIIISYDILLTGRWGGQTVGKKLLQIRIVKSDGSPPQIGHYFLRRIPILIYAYFITLFFAEDVLIGMTFGNQLNHVYYNYLELGNLFSDSDIFFVNILFSLVCGLILSFPILRIRKGRVLGDLIAGTIVVRSMPVITKEIKESGTENKPEVSAPLINNIAEASKNARNIYLLYIGLLAYCALTVASTSDQRIILNEPARLPVISLDVSLDGFFILAPILAIFIFVYFQLYLLNLKRLLDDLRTNYRPIKESQQIYPWMLNFVSEVGSGFVARVQRLIVNFSLWWSLPLVLMLLALWYLKKHDPLLSSVVGTMPLIGVILVVAFWIQYQKPPNSPPKFQKDQRILLGIVLVMEIYLFAVFMPRALRGERLIGTWPAVDLSYKNLANKQDEVYWVNLRDADLQGADFTASILDKADLRQANLKGAIMEETQLKGADLRGAKLQGCDLEKADLQKAKLDSAIFELANLQGVRLDSASLRGTIFRGTRLDNTNLSSALFEGADFKGINGVDYEKMSPQLKKAVAISWKNHRLRMAPNKLTKGAVRLMLQRNGFFDRYMNEFGSGFPHQFEVLEGGCVILDSTSELFWQQSGSRDDYMKYDSAAAYVEQLNEEKFAGFSDWRLPTLEEAMSLMEPKKINGLHIHPLFNHLQLRIWTADSDRYSKLNDWIVYFDDGSCGDYGFGPLYVRAVRSGHLLFD